MAKVRSASPDSASDPVGGVLFFEDGSIFYGEGFGAPTRAVGEVVFTTGMAGYPESITDPSYRGQILLFTYPLQGNYGVPAADRKDAWGFPLGMESGEVQPRAVIARSLTAPHHWTSGRSLSEWLRSAGVPGIAGLDTRAIAERLRAQGVQRGVVAVGKDLPSPDALRKILEQAPQYHEEDFVRQVAPRKPALVRAPRTTPAPGGAGGRPPLVAVMDVGCKASILRNLLARGADVLRSPPGMALPERWEGRRVDGYLISNGPGDPGGLSDAITMVKERPRDRPTFGICLGHQLLALSAGASTYKMKYGHRGQNKPLLFRQPAGRAYIVSENHGYAVDRSSLKGTGLAEWAYNPDDGTVEGFRDHRGLVLGVQGHPEGAPGPHDAEFLFDTFLDKVRRRA